VTTENQRLVDYDWLIQWHGRRESPLHYVELPPELVQAEDLVTEIAVQDPALTTACGRTMKGLVIPGIFTRMGAMRCRQCCMRLGFPPGKGSPKNDDRCRRILGLDVKAIR
jgi:hypothetical protein